MLMFGVIAMEIYVLLLNVKYGLKIMDLMFVGLYLLSRIKIADFSKISTIFTKVVHILVNKLCHNSFYFSKRSNI